MKSGVRALGVAESYRGPTSTLAGVVARASRVVDGFAFADCTVGGTDATDAVIDLWERLDRADVRYVLVAGIAPAWYNVLDLHRLHGATDRPVVSVTFEESAGLEPAIREAFKGVAAERRIDTYRAQPPRERVLVDGDPLFYRAVGLDAGHARDLLRAFTPEGGRPEPLRVARMAARGAERWRFPGEQADPSD
ncbi:MAG: DUF99 family protein [Halobacteriales archaeon]